MNVWKRLGLLATTAALVMLLTTGCASNKRTETRVVEEQHEGEVTEEAPGRMIVE